MSDRVVVVGAGITGLTAAYRLKERMPAASIAVIEADDRCGGKIRSSAFAGLDGVDEGADAFLTRVPDAVALAGELGLGEALTSPAVMSAGVWWNGLHPLPEGLLLGMPSDAIKLAGSRLLTWPGKLRAALEPILPATTPAIDAVGHDSLGWLIRTRFGRQVHERLVDPLVGSIYATDTDHFSLAGVPQIEHLATNNRSLLIGARRLRANTASTAPAGPVFAAPTAGMSALTDALARRLVESSVELRLGERVEEVRRDETHGTWLVDGARADAVILATPARMTAPLVATVSRDAAGSLASFEHAGVVIVTLAVPVDEWPRALHRLSGYLVPKPVQRWVTAVSFASAKWAHWRPVADPAGGDRAGFILRISLGRDGRDLTAESDDALLSAAIDEVGGHLGVTLRPTEHRITRWPMGFPQYRPGHAARVAAVEAALARDAPGVFVCGASYHGIGIPACIRQSNEIAAAVSAFLDRVRN